MIAQRAPSAASVAQGSATSLPFADKTFDSALAILTLHHWPEQRRGLQEMARVARKRCVILTWAAGCPFWLNDYFPEILERDRTIFSLDLIAEVFPRMNMRPVPVPHDCTDGFMCAYWRRPEAYFDPGVRGAISSFAYVHDVEKGLAALRSDLDDGSWMNRNGHLASLEECDLGYRLVVAEMDS
jgi:SAM-dependent methyltransferase